MGRNELCNVADMNRSELERRVATFAQDIFRQCALIRQRSGGREPANQLQNAASSAAANYRASARSRSANEFIARIGTVNEESDEAVYWLEFITTTGLAVGEDLNRLLDEARQLRAIFAASYATARRNHRARANRSTSPGARLRRDGTPDR